jgi:hypothetical protein
MVSRITIQKTMQRIGSKVGVLVLVAGLFFVGCEPDDIVPSPPPPEPETEYREPLHPQNGEAPREPMPPDPPASAADPAWEGTTSEVRSEQNDYSSATLVDVRFASQNGFDRAVFELTDDLPGYTVRYVDRPAECGSGHPVEVSGEHYLEISLSPAAAHELENGERRPTIANTEMRVGTGLIREAVQTCDHHGGVTWVLGLAEEARFRVLDLEEPYRLVVDLRD